LYGFVNAVKVSCILPPSGANECHGIVTAFLQSGWGIVAPEL
jgi:hypothetical protein